MDEIQRIDLAAAESMDAYVKAGDLAKLNPQQRADLYAGICRSMGLNPLTRPFEFITLQGKLTLYAKKDCTDQLRRIYQISLQKPTLTIQDGIIIAEVGASTPDGRTDYDIGAVVSNGKGNDHANALKKAISQAKRRVTLSICGLGFLDETEIEQIPGAQPYVEMVEEDAPILPSPAQAKNKAKGKADIRKLGEFTLLLGNSLFTEEEYSKVKLKIKEMAGLSDKPMIAMKPEDMEKYAQTLIAYWLMENAGFDSASAFEVVKNLAKEEKITESDVESIVSYCLALLPESEVV